MSSQHVNAIEKSLKKLRMALNRRAFIKVEPYSKSKFLYQVTHPYFKGMSKFSELVRLIYSSGFLITEPIADEGYFVIFKPKKDSYY